MSGFILQRLLFDDLNVIQEPPALVIVRIIARGARTFGTQSSKSINLVTLNARKRHFNFGSIVTRLSRTTPNLIEITSHSKPARAMADDASYTNFLNKANQDVSSGGSNQPQSTSQARSKFDPTLSGASNGSVPKPIADIKATYTSDTDSDFEPVFFSYSGSGLPSSKDFEKCMDGRGKAEELSEKGFDPRGHYKQVIDAVKSVGKGVKIFRVELGGTRVEYYILTVSDGKLLGVVAKAVES